jgi:hypothetical protein
MGITVSGKPLETYLASKKQLETRELIEEESFRQVQSMRKLRIKDRRPVRRKVYRTKLWTESEIRSLNEAEEALPALKYHLRQTLYKKGVKVDRRTGRSIPFKKRR